MGKTKKVGITGKFGSRYGSLVRNRILEVESKKSKKCPHCGRNQIKRVAAGIWECNKCKNKFTGGAYITEFSKDESKAVE